MISTNDIPQIAQAVSDAGVKLTATQITFIVAAGGAAARWVRSEIALGIKTWTNIGGLAGFKAWFYGSKPASTPPETK